MIRAGLAVLHLVALPLACLAREGVAPFAGAGAPREVRVAEGPERGGQATGETPILRTVFKTIEAIPGQPLDLRLTVLVPTFMPAPPIWPSFEAPNLLVRLPERGTSPTSERIGGRTWSGVTRRYRISPMVPGGFRIPPREVVVTWSDPEGRTPLRTVLTTEPLAFSGVLPEGAEGLDPFLAAKALEMTQAIDGRPQTMEPGDSATRTVTVEVEGVSPMFLPDLLTPVAIEGVATYPDEPLIAETETRGTVSGTRGESVTLVAEGGGRGELPAISLDWYDLSAGRVRTASVEGIVVAVDGPPVRRDEPGDWRLVAAIAAGGLAAFVAALLVARRMLPPLGRWIAARRATWRASEAHAWRALRRAVARRDHACLRPALDLWAARTPGADPRRHARVRDALLSLGAARYRATASGDEAAAWRALAGVLPEARRDCRRTARMKVLPPLNPAT